MRAPRSVGGRGAWSLGVLLAVVACRGGGRTGEEAAAREASAPAASSPAASASAVEPSPAPVPPPPPPCRALGVAGTVTASSRAVGEGAPVGGDAWVELGAGAKATFKHAASGREIGVFGPGVALPCAGGEEVVLLQEGRVEVVPGPGARPGAEVWVATPRAVVAWPEGRVKVEASRSGVTVQVLEGRAEVHRVPARAGGESVTSLGGPRGRLVVREAVAAQRALEHCEARAGAAEQAAVAVVRPPPDAAPLGERAAAHVRARRGARLACLLARAAVGRAAGVGERERLEAAERKWRAVPRPDGSGTNPGGSAP